MPVFVSRAPPVTSRAGEHEQRRCACGDEPGDGERVGGRSEDQRQTDQCRSDGEVDLDQDRVDGEGRATLSRVVEAMAPKRARQHRDRRHERPRNHRQRGDGCEREMQRCRKEQQAERGRMHDAGRDENPVRPVAIDQPSLDRGRARHGDEVGTDHGAGEWRSRAAMDRQP